MLVCFVFILSKDVDIVELLGPVFSTLMCVSVCVWVDGSSCVQDKRQKDKRCTCDIPSLAFKQGFLRA